MPVQLQIISASEFVCLGDDQFVDFETTKKNLLSIVLACEQRGLDRAMLDVREVPFPDKPYLTLPQIASLAGTFREAGFTRHERLAILYKWDDYGGVRNFAFFSKMRGLQVQAFHKFEDAMLWLSEHPAQSHHEAPAPIRHRAKKRLTNSSARVYKRPHQPARRVTKGNPA